MSAEFFSGPYPEFDLTAPQGRKAMVAKVKELKGTKSEGFTEAREVSPILDVATTVVGECSFDFGCRCCSRLHRRTDHSE